MQAKKSLGQNFLADPAILKKIVGVSEVENNDLVLEIGPGHGTLTQEILTTGANVIAVEKDHRLIATLTEKFAEKIKTGQLKIIEADILNFAFEALEAKAYKLIGNVPYYISGEILRKFLTSKNQPQSMTLLLQKEVVERIVAKKESLLSLSVKVYGEPKKEFIVKAGSFRPAPKVDSAVLTIKNISRKKFIDAGHEQKFFEIIHQGFAHKRKQLKNNLIIEAGITVKCGVNLTQRAEALTLENWLCLSH